MTEDTDLTAPRIRSPLGQWESFAGISRTFGEDMLYCAIAIDADNTLDLFCESHQVQYAIEALRRLLDPIPLLHADSPTYRNTYPHFSKTYDANGNLIRGIFCCNTETGLVFTLDPEKNLNDDGTLRLIPSIHPAPLTIVANTAPPDVE